MTRIMAELADEEPPDVTAERLKLLYGHGAQIGRRTDPGQYRIFPAVKGLL